MMNRLFLSLLSIVFLVLSSCKEKEEYTGPTTDFGTSEYYPAFLFSKSDTLRLSKKLKYDFNDYAVKKGSSIRLKLVNTAQKAISDNNIRFYVNGKLIDNNEFNLTSEKSKKGTLNIGLQLLPGYPEGYTSGFLSISNHSLDVVNNSDLNTSKEKRLFKWEATHKIVMNPLKKGLIWTGVVFIAILFIWFLILKPIVYPRFGRGSLTIQSPLFKSILLHKSIGLTLSNNSIKQKWMEMFFKGRELHYSNPIFPAPIIFTPHSKNKIRIQLDPTYSIQPFTTTLNKGAGQHIITNLSTKEKITITFG